MVRERAYEETPCHCGMDCCACEHYDDNGQPDFVSWRWFRSEHCLGRAEYNISLQILVRPYKVPRR